MAGPEPPARTIRSRPEYGALLGLLGPRAAARPRPKHQPMCSSAGSLSPVARR